MAEEGLFRSAQDALRFAFNYSGQQSPMTPMTRLLAGPGIGKGLGMVGLDGAAQAGIILARLDKLTAQQRNVLTVSFGDVRMECPCCGQLAPSDEWRDAIDALSHCAELEGVPRPVRYAAIEKAICRRKWDAKRLSQEYGISLSTLHRQVRALKDRLGRVESQALNALADSFRDTGLLIEE